MTFAPADIDLIENAAAILDGVAGEIQHSSAVPPDFTKWPYPGDKDEHDATKKASAALYALAERMKAAI